MQFRQSYLLGRPRPHSLADAQFFESEVAGFHLKNQLGYAIFFTSTNFRASRSLRTRTSAFPVNRCLSVLKCISTANRSSGLSPLLTAHCSPPTAHFWCSHVFSSKADAEQPRRNAPQEWPALY